MSLPGPEQSSRGSLRPRRRRIAVDPAGRLERADQYRGGAAVGLADRVQHAVDPVGEVDVGAAGRAEDRRRPRRQADVGVTGGIVTLVALGLDDHPADPVHEQLAADQLARDLVHRAVEELGAESAQPASARRRSRASRAAASCSASRADEVPPAETLGLQPGALAQDLVVLVVEQLGVGGELLAVELRERRAVLERGPHQPADHAVSLAERHPLAHQQVGDVGGRDDLVARRRGQPLAVEAQPGEQSLGGLEAELDRVDRVEQRLLVLLEVLGVGERQRVQDPGQGCESGA